MPENNTTLHETEEEVQSQNETISEDPAATQKKLKRANRKLTEFQFFGIQAFAFVLVVYILFAWIIGVTAPPNGDMSPRIDATDLLVFYRLDKVPQANNIIIFKKNDTRYVARVIAAAGDSIEITEDGAVIVNGSVLSESQIFYETFPLTGYTKYPLTLKDDECFVMVDQRKGAEDSRYFGPVKYSEIEGTVITVMRRTNF